MAIAVTTLITGGCASTSSARWPSSTPPKVISADAGDVASDVALHFMRRHPAAALEWSWESGIFTFAVARLAQTDPTGEWSEYLVEHYRAHAEPHIRRPDDCAPALGAAVVLGTGEASVRPALETVALYLRDAPRNPLGALDHLDPRTPLGRVYPPSIWVDSLVMYGLSAALVGQALGDHELLAFAHAQPKIFATHLQDPATGLFRHAYLHERKRNRPEGDVFWLRGNGWVAMALVELLTTMDPAQPQWLSTQVILRRLAAGLMAHRSREGTWTTVIDAPRTYEETSGTALVAYALAKGARLGFLPPQQRELARQTLHTLEERLRSRRGGPVVAGTSGPTIPSRRTGYAVVRRGADLPYGVGAYLLLASELRLDQGDDPTTDSPRSSPEGQSIPQ